MRDIAPDIGFADATFESCELVNGKLIITLSSWDDQYIKVIFFNIIKFIYKIESVVSGAYETSDEQELLKDSLLLYYNTIPNKHPFKVFVIRDIDDEDFLKVVAEKVEVIKEKKHK